MRKLTIRRVDAEQTTVKVGEDDIVIEGVPVGTKLTVAVFHSNDPSYEAMEAIQQEMRRREPERYSIVVGVGEGENFEIFEEE